MLSTIERLLKYHENNSKIIIWEHTTNIGDAWATDMASEGMVNLGQLLKDQYLNQGIISLGSGSY